MNAAATDVERLSPGDLIQLSTARGTRAVRR
jgi:hypothetical protein